MRRLSLTILVVLLSVGAFAQISLPAPISINPNINVQNAIEDLFSGCVEVSNINYTGHFQARGTFDNGTEAIGLESGFIMSTGKIIDALGPNYPGTPSLLYQPGDTTFTREFGVAGSNDAALLTFDVVPHSHVLTMKYVFASEGYNVDLNSPEGVGIFVTGPIIGGGMYNEKNIAVVSTTGEYITINNVGPINNTNLYMSNPFGMPGHGYDGYTVPMLATLECVPCQTYSFKIVVADVNPGGQAYDSAVFLAEEGTQSSFDLDLVSISFAGGEYDIYEGCTNQLVVQRINPDTAVLAQPFYFQVTMAGTAIDSVDYVGITDSLYVIPGGDYFTTLDYYAILDGAIEGTETMIINVSHISICDSSCVGDYTMTIEVIDNFDLAAGINMNDTNICSYNTTFMLLETFLPPDTDPNLVSYNWNTNSFSDQINIQPPLDQSTTYIVTITDVCGQQAIDSVTITNSSFSGITVGVEDNECYGDAAGTVTVQTQNGFEPFLFDWTPAFLGTTSEGYLDSLYAGQYSVTVSDSIGCNYTKDFYVNQPDSIYTAVTRHNPLCFEDSNGKIEFQTFNGVPPFTYLWSTGDTTQVLDSIPEGIYSVTATDLNQCTVEAVDTLDDPNLLQLWTIDDVFVCKYQTISLEAQATGGTPTYFYVWEHGASGSQVQITPEETATYFVHVEDLNGCTTPVQAITINVYPDITVELFTSTDSICKGDQTVIYADIVGGTGGPYETIWSDGSNTDIVAPPYTVSPELTTEYEIWVKDVCGSPTGNYIISIEVFDAPEIEVVSDIFDGCIPLTVAFDELVNDSTAKYDWDFGDGVFNILHNEKTPVHIYEKEGNYDITVEVTSKVGCKSTEVVSQLIEVYRNPTARFYPDPAEASIVKPIIFFNNISNDAFISTWNFGDSTEISNSNSPEHFYSEPGEYEIRLLVETENGCLDSFVQYVNIKSEYTFYAPNAFNPNSDIDENKTFMPTGLGIDEQNFHLIIYDRTGSKIYESFDIYRPWNGEANGRTAKEGETYPWVVIYRDLAGQEHREAGTVSIIK
jgi:PKD repeat protein